MPEKMPNALADGYVIRRAGANEAAEAQRIAVANFTEAWCDDYSTLDLQAFVDSNYSEEQHRQILSEPDQFAIFFVVYQGEVVGHALLGPCSLPHADIQAQDGEIKRMYLLNAHHNQGIGEQLMRTALEWLMRDGPRTIWLGVWSENQRAQRFYQRHGFRKAGDYTFIVGDTHDHEFIFSRPPDVQMKKAKSAQD